MKLINKLTIGALALPIAVIPAITSCKQQPKQKQEQTKFEIDNNGLVTLKDKSLKEVTIPAVINEINVQGIATNGFKESKVETVSFEAPNQIVKICDYAFKDCTSLKSFVLPKNVTYLGSSAFSGCTSLQTFNFADGIKLQTLKERTFENTNFYEITIPSNIMTMEKNLFAYSGSTALKKVNFATTVGWKQTTGQTIESADMKPDQCADNFHTFGETDPNNWGYTGIVRTAKTATVDATDTSLANFTITQAPASSISEKDGLNIIDFTIKTKAEAYNGQYVIWINNASGYLLKETIYNVDSGNETRCMFVLDDWTYITTGETVTIKAMKK